MKLNPASSLLLAFVYTLFLSFSNFEYYFFIPLVFLLILKYKNIFQILKNLIFLNLFIVFIAIFLYFETNFNEAFFLFLRVNMIILFNLLLFFDSKAFDIVKGFYLLNFPKKFVSTLYFTIKMIWELKLEIQKIKESLETRNFKAKTNLFTYQTFGNIFGLLFLKTMQKSSNLKDSFETRLFKGEIFLNDSFKLAINDILFIILVLSIPVLKVVL